MLTITFITGNKDKIESAKKIFAKYPNIQLLNQKIDTPEIQSMDVEKIALFSAEYASKLLNKTIMKLDCGYYIPALNNFPGPFVKYFQNSFTMDDFLSLMKRKKDRTIIIKESLALSTPGKISKVFTAEIKAKLAKVPRGEGGIFDRLVVYSGFDKPQAACNYQEIINYWNLHLDHYQKLAIYLDHALQVE